MPWPKMWIFVQSEHTETIWPGYSGSCTFQRFLEQGLLLWFTVPMPNWLHCASSWQTWTMACRWFLNILANFFDSLVLFPHRAVTQSCLWETVPPSSVLVRAGSPVQHMLFIQATMLCQLQLFLTANRKWMHLGPVKLKDSAPQWKI